MKLYLFLITNFLIVSNTFSQVDFNDYQTIKSVGKIPNDFTQATYDKVNNDLQNSKGDLSKKEQHEFLNGIYYNIDALLHSGLVTYGDPISLYIEDIAKKLLKNDKELLSKLRFYTVKVNETNAFSTDQGIIFFTSGLISQVTSEAQIAYVLAHEIAHFTEEHVIETFSWKNDRRNHNYQIEKMSQYSKEKEFEADKIAVKMYHDAGYSMEEIYKTFDVLMYSYLPFDEVEFPKNYFNTDHYYIPESLFSSKKFEITAEEDYDDSKSSHPNIKKRKDSLDQIVNAYTNWKSEASIFGNDRFEEIRNIARFETVRSDLIDANYADALYSIFLLEKSYPNSIYLQRKKAQAWLGLINYKTNNKGNSVVKKQSDLEGEIATVHLLIKKLNQQEVVTLGLRQIYDLKQNAPEDKEINAIYHAALSAISKVEKFDISNYSNKTFSLAVSEYLETVVTKDTAIIEQKESKYDKIKSKKNPNEAASFDSLKYYLYGLSDVIENELFLSEFDKYKIIESNRVTQDNEFKALSYKERKKINKENEKNEIKLGVDNLIVCEPQVISYKHNRIARVKSEVLGEKFSQAIELSGKDVGIDMTIINRNSLEREGTVTFNERTALYAFFQQIIDAEDFEVFPVDYSAMEELRETYGSSRVLFTVVKHSYSPDFNASVLLTSILFYPVLPIYIPSVLISGNNTEMTFVILDLEKGVIEFGKSFYTKDPVNKYFIYAHTFDILSQLNQSPK